MPEENVDLVSIPWKLMSEIFKASEALQITEKFDQFDVRTPGAALNKMCKQLMKNDYRYNLVHELQRHCRVSNVVEPGDIP